LPAQAEAVGGHRPYCVTASSPRLNAQIIAFTRANPDPDPETAMAQREIKALLEAAIDRLPQPFCLVLVAQLIEGMSVEETADLFGILPQTVKTRVHRARAFSKREMEKHIDPILGDAFPFAGRRRACLADRVFTLLGFA
jgi:RNA polymerase sigma-70 factor (ECF subfamily)